MGTITLVDISTSRPVILAKNITGENGVNSSNQWCWIVDHIIEAFRCSENSVGCLETENGDCITIDGKPVAFLDIDR